VKRIVTAVLLGVALAGCGVSSQDEPEILRSPPSPPTATPSATERPTATLSGTVPPTATPVRPAGTPVRLTGTPMPTPTVTTTP
jgi:hypothetical protein